MVLVDFDFGSGLDLVWRMYCHCCERCWKGCVGPPDGIDVDHTLNSYCQCSLEQGQGVDGKRPISMALEGLEPSPESM